MTEIKAVIFDMDGVLVDAKEWHYEALNHALALFGYEITRSDHIETFDGLPTMRKLEILTKERGLPAGLHGFINEMKQQYTFDVTYARCRPNFIHQYALSRLRSQGYSLAVASNSMRKTVELMMAKCRLDRYLDLTLAATDVSNAKPHPEIYLTAVERLGLEPDQCLVLEDNDHGIQAAKAAGTHVLVVNDVTDVNLANISAQIASIEAGVS